jgi:hypothetical protein
MRQEITNINFSLSTFCNMKCPDCCCNITHMANRDKRFFDWEYMVKSAKYFQGMDRIHITGGEPTIHPKFIMFVPLLKELFQCERLTLETNGWGFDRFPHVFPFFDEIYISHYTEDTFAGSPDNTKQIEFLKQYFELLEPNTKLIVGEVVHTPRDTRGKSGKCSRGDSETVAYSNGKIYGCCVAPGLDSDTGILISENWRNELPEPPCHQCFFAI